ncbi:MAG: hypothetical protein R3200_00970 [Xanthomonadales bacterium]|nr:hypothetical protein [Xanthomonadales bacterium]
MGLVLATAAVLVTASEQAVTEVKLREMPDGRWIVAFRFPEPQRAVVFRQAPEPYRAGHWTSLTEGVALETVGQTDVMLFEPPARQAVFEIEPHTTSLAKAYTPFLAFTDGGWGVLEGQFRVSSATGRAEVAAFEGNGESWPGDLFDYTLTIESERSLFHGGAWADGSLELSPEGDGSYVYVGDARVETSENYVGFIDRGLPAWIRDQLDDDLTAIFAELSTEWGFTLPEPVEVLFVFDGAEHPGLAQTGGALGQQLALQVSGDALLEPDASILAYFRWFLAHESAHVYQNAAGMPGVPAAHAWMQEGVANTMAHRISGRLAEDRKDFLGEVYGRAFADCVAYLDTGAPLAAAIQTGRFDAYYACGDLIALVTEAGLAEGDIFEFWRAFLETSEAEEVAEIAPDHYFRLARSRGLAEGTARRLEALVFEPVSHPYATLRELLETAGLAPRFDEEGKLESLDLPR